MFLGFHFSRNTTAFSNYNRSATALPKMQRREGKNKIHVIWMWSSPGVCYFVFSVSQFVALQALQASSLSRSSKRISLDSSSVLPCPGPAVSEVFAKSPTPPGCCLGSPLASVFKFWIIYLLLLIYWFPKNSSDSFVYTKDTFQNKYEAQLNSFCGKSQVKWMTRHTVTPL